MRTRSGAVVAVWIAALLGGCQAIDDPPPKGLAAELEDREFLSIQVMGRELVEGTRVRVSFHEGELGFSAGCNHFSGPFRIEGDVLRITGLGGTEIGCEPDLADQDDWIAKLLTGSPTIRYDEDTQELTIAKGGDGLVLLDRELASPDRELVGTQWIGNGHGDGQAVTFAPGSGEVTLHLGVDGFIQVFTSCQHGDGTFTSNDMTIELGSDFAYDGASCADPAFSAVDQQVVAVLDGSPVTYEIEEANLTIESGNRLLLFRAGD